MEFSDSSGPIQPNVRGALQTGRGTLELFDREVLVVAVLHVALQSRVELFLGRRGLPFAGCELVALALLTVGDHEQLRLSPRP